MLLRIRVLVSADRTCCGPAHLQPPAARFSPAPTSRRPPGNDPRVSIPDLAEQVTMRMVILTGLLALSAAILTTACSDPVETDPSTPPAAQDHEFDAGSKIVAQDLTAIQVDNLALLAKVWGFAKYHHPGVVDGSRSWDYEMFRAVPHVLAAADRATASAALVTWLDGVASVPACRPCAQLPGGAHLPPENGWIEDAAVLGAALSDRLVSIHVNRPVAAAQRYVGFAPNVGNPDFTRPRSASASSPIWWCARPWRGSGRGGTRCWRRA